MPGNLMLVFIFFVALAHLTDKAEPYDPLDPLGQVTVRWDVVVWNPDGYVAVMTIHNGQKYRHFQPPGWRLGWRWAAEEVVWAAKRAEATEQGNCSEFKGSDIPHSCKRSPTMVDLLPGTPYNQQVANCCRGGVLTSLVQDPASAVGSFQITVGRAGSSAESVRLPESFTLLPGYTCGPANKTEPSKFVTPDGRRVTQAQMTWSVTCTYSPFRAQRTPTCCVALSTFYSQRIVGCPTCACGCKGAAPAGSCVDPNSPNAASAVSSDNQRIQCTNHMCPVKVHWHVQEIYKLYWRVKITVGSFNYGVNYTQWNVVVRHPGFANLNRVYSFEYAPVAPYGSPNDTVMLWGRRQYNDVLLDAGHHRNAQSEMLFKKDDIFTLRSGWAFPRSVYFNGDECAMPLPDSYPDIPKKRARSYIPLVVAIGVFVAIAVYLCRSYYLVVHKGHRM